MLRVIPTALAATLALAATPARAGQCDTLEKDAADAAKALLGKLKGYGCCEGKTLAECRAAKDCALGERLAEDVCRQVRFGATSEAVEKALGDRRRSLTNVPEKDLAWDASAATGDLKAPVKVVAFVCSRCPFCKDVTLNLHRLVNPGGELFGKAQLMLRPFPLKGHDGAAEGDLALVAAASQGKLWPYAVFQYKNFDQFHPSVLSDWAGFAGLDQTAFDAAFADPKTRDALAESKKEGLKHQVKATPTLFIDGRRYEYSMEGDVLQDVLFEVWERVAGPKP